MDDDNKLENVLHKGALTVGIAMLLGSMYLSYDGFDQSVSGANSEYTILAAAIGITLAIAVTILEFIVSSRPEGLNVTLKVIGLLAYFYSIYTNYLGASNLMHMNKGFAVGVALFMDIVPEPLIAWGLGEAIMHDLFKNLGSFATSPVGKGGKGKGGGGGGGNQQRQFQSQPNHGNHNNNQSGQKKGGGGSVPQSRPTGGGGHARLSELQKQFHAAGSSNGNGYKPQKISRSFLDELDEEDE